MFLRRKIMRIIFSIFAIFLLTVFNNYSSACDVNGNTGFVKENGLWIPDIPGMTSNNVTKETFHEALDRVQAIYEPVINALGKKFIIHRNWDSGVANAYAQRKGDRWIISMYGGLARHEATTLDSFTLVACHEVGHHLGGVPRSSSLFGIRRFTNEGQSDYFSSTKCFRKVIENDDNVVIMSQVDVPEYVMRKCEDNFLTAQSIAACTRTAMGSLSVARLMWHLGKRRGPEVNFETPDPKVVRSTYDDHPAPQCRLDTYFAGALCDKDPYADMSDDDPNINTCSRAENYIDGIRPLCWYKPRASKR